MSRLLVASHNASLRVALSHGGHEVVDLPDEADLRWDEHLDETDVVVLDLDDPVASELLIDHLAARVTQDVRVLLLAGAGSDWDDVPRERAGVSLIQLPFTLPELSGALEALLDGEPLQTKAQSSPGLVDAPLDASVPVAPTADELPDPDEAEPPAVADVPVTSPAESRSPSYIAIDPAVLTNLPSPRIISLVRTLSAAVDSLSTVGETSEVILSEVINLVPYDSAAVLVHDGDVWRVSRAVELRPLEERLSLSPEHWLVRKTMGSSGVILTNGGGRLPELYGVPMADRPHLLTTPLPPAGALLLLARDEVPFTQAELEALLPFADEAGHLMADAFDVRQLARQLAHAIEPLAD